jgi:hypothetical protein
MLNKTIKPIEIKSGNQPAGIGYITIPNIDELDREQFIEDCYRTHSVCIFGGVQYGMFYDVSIDKEVLKSINFPREKGQKGSPVVWVNIPPWNKPVIISVLKHEDEYYFNEEDSMNHSREHNENYFDISTSTKDGKVTINLKTRPGVAGKINVNVISPSKNGEINVYVKGKAKIHSTEETKIVSDKKITLHVLDEKSQDKVVITYEREKGFTYIDEFGNKIICKDGEYSVDSKKIKHNSGKEPMVLGDTLVSLLEDILTEVTKLTVTTPIGPSGTPINIAQFQKLKSRVKDIKSKISNLD